MRSTSTHAGNASSRPVRRPSRRARSPGDRKRPARCVPKGGDSLLGRYDLFHLHPFTLGNYWRKEAGRAVTSEFGQCIEAPASCRVPPRGSISSRGSRDFLSPLRGAGTAHAALARSRANLCCAKICGICRASAISAGRQLVALLPERIGSPLSSMPCGGFAGGFDTVKDGWRPWSGSTSLRVASFSGRLAALAARSEGLFIRPHEIDDPGARFENMVALHLLKLVDFWNDVGHGDFALWYVRDKEKREVDFLVTDRRKPFLLVEAKLSDSQPSPPALLRRAPIARWAIQVVRRGDPRLGPVRVLPAERFLNVDVSPRLGQRRGGG